MKWRRLVSVSRGAAKASASICRTLAVLGMMLPALIFTPAESRAQDCTDCVTLYAGTELNLRQEPSLEGTVLRFIPRGATVQRTAGKDQNGYAPVVYDSVAGWAVALGFVKSEAEVLEFVVPGTGAASPAPATVASDDARVTLSPLVLRGGPAADADPVLTMPEGAQVTLTREGAENGYVTVEYDGAIGWAFADLLAEAVSDTGA
jgi:uncharacterized protein YgiM (DUF1202 family)